MHTQWLLAHPARLQPGIRIPGYALSLMSQACAYALGLFVMYTVYYRVYDWVPVVSRELPVRTGVRRSNK